MAIENDKGDSTPLVRALLETEGDAILATDRAGMITFWNPGAERIFGWPFEEVRGQSLDIIIPENLRARHWEGWAHSLATGTSHYGAGQVLSVPALNADGKRISVEFTIMMLHDEDGRIGGIAAIMRDVTAHFEEMRLLRKQVATLTGRP